MFAEFGKNLESEIQALFVQALVEEEDFVVDRGRDQSGDEADFEAPVNRLVEIGERQGSCADYSEFLAAFQRCQKCI